MTYTKTRRGRSWHVVKSYEPPRTRCGRGFDPDAETFDQLGAGKSCELCLRLVAREVDGWVSG